MRCIKYFGLKETVFFQYIKMIDICTSRFLLTAYYFFIFDPKRHIMPKSTLFKLSLMIFICTISGNAAAQCDTKITPSDNATIAYRSRGNRCEGFYRAKVAANVLRVVSFTLGEFRFNPTATEVIEIKTSGADGAVHFRAEGIPNDLYYRLDCEFPAQSGFSWPVKDVLLKEPRTQDARNIGLLARVGQYYLPVKATGKSAAADASPQALVKLVCTTRVSKVIWRISGQNDYVTLPGDSFPAGRNIIIRLPNSLKGKNTIEVKAKSADGTDWMNVEVPVQL